MRRSLMAAVAALVLVVSGCSANTSADSSIDPTDTKAVAAANVKVLDTVTVKESGDTVTLDAKWPLTFTGIGVKVAVPGTGEVINEGDGVYYDTVAFNAADGKEQQSTLKRKGANYAFVESGSLADELLPLLKGAKLGTLLLLSQPGQAAQGAAAAPGNVVVIKLVKRASRTPIKEVPAAEAPAVTVAEGAAPTYVASKAAAPTASTFAVTKKGTGQPIVKDDSIKGHILGWQWADAKKVIDTTTTTDAQGATTPATAPATLDLKAGGLYPCIRDALVGQNIGATLVISCAASDGAGDTTPDTAVEESKRPAAGAVVLYVQAIASTKAALVTKDKLPAVKMETAKPALTKPSGDPLPETSVAVLTPGTGTAVAANSKVTVNYSGWKWSDGTQFDSSYGREPFTFTANSGGVIPCWDLATAGQKAGAELLVSCTAADAYGDNPPAGYPAGVLVFYIKIDKVA